MTVVSSGIKLWSNFLIPVHFVFIILYSIDNVEWVDAPTPLIWLMSDGEKY